MQSAYDNKALSERQFTWNYDRCDMYPELFADECAKFKAGRAADLLRDYNEFRAEVAAEMTTIMMMMGAGATFTLELAVAFPSAHARAA